MSDPRPDLLLDEDEQQPDARDADQLLAELFGRVNERLTGTRTRGPELTELPQFFDRQGTPIANLATRENGTILALRRNPETGAIQIDVYSGADAARRRAPAVTMDVSYSESDGNVTERRQVTDMTTPPPRVPTTIETSRGQQPGDLSISINTPAGERQIVSFRNGVPERLEVTQQVNGQPRTLSFSFQDGQITGVRLNGSEITGAAAQEFIAAAQETLATVAVENDITLANSEEQPVSFEDDEAEMATEGGAPQAKPADSPAPVVPPVPRGDTPPPPSGTVPSEKPAPPPGAKPGDVPASPVTATTPIAVPFRVSDATQHRAPESARDGDRLRAGTFDGPDGSRIEYATAPDGTVRPRSITFRDGSRSEYTYDQAGRVLEVVNKNARNQVVSRFFTEDDGETYIEEDATRTPPQRREPAAGAFSIRDDGTFAFRSGNSVLETQSDGTIVRRFQAADGPRETYVRPDGTVLQLVTVAGQLRPGSATLPDRTRVDFVYDAAGRTTDVVLLRANGQQTRYENRDGGSIWTERPSGRTGELTLRDGYQPQFTARDAAGAPPEVREVPPPSDRSGPYTDRDRAVFLQQRLTAVLDGMYAPRFAQEQQRIMDEAVRRANETRTPVNQDEVRRQIEAANTRLRAEMEETRRALTLEMQAMQNATDVSAAWANSPVTQRVYRDCINWMEQQAIPAALRRMSGSAAVDLPPGSPVPVPQQDGLFLIPELFRAQAATGGLPRPDFGIAGVRPGDTRPLQPPSDADLQSLGRGLNWLLEAQRRMDRQRLDYELTVLLPEIISRNNLPPGWLQEVGRNPEQRRAALQEMVDLSLQVRNYSTAIITLGLDRTGVANLPPGASPVIEGTHPNRRVTRLNLDLPQNLDMQNPENLRRVEALRQWLRDNGPRVEQAMQEWANSQDPSRQVFFGEIQTTGRVVAGADGRPTEIMDPRDPRNRDRLASGQEFNLLDCGFSVRREGGQIVLETTVQPRSASWYNYLNIGAPAVGQPFRSEPRRFNPTDPVAIRDASGQTHIIQAQNLEGWLREQQFLHYGSKALTATMDIGMVVASGGSGVAAAAAWRAGSITTGAAIRHLAVAGTRGLLGGSGFFLNNASVHASEFGRTVNDVRGLAMTLDVAQGTVRQLGGGALRWIRGAEVAGTLTTAQRIEQAVAQAGWITRTMHGAERGAHVVMEVSNVPYMPLIAGDIMSHVRHLNQAGQTSPFERAARMIQDGRDRQPPPRDAAEAAARQTREAATAALETYTTQLCRGRDEQTQNRIRELMTRAARMMDPAAPAEERQRFQQELMTIMYGSAENLGAQIRDEELRRGRPLTDAEVRTLRANSFTPNPDMQAAAAAAYLFAFRGENGRLPDTLSDRSVTVPAYQRTVSTERGSATVQVPERTVSQSVTPTDIMNFLRQDVTNTDSPSRRLVTGDLLVRAGQRDPLSYAAILRDIVSDTRASSADRIEAMMRLGPMINALHLQESRSGAPGSGYGVSAADLERVLRDAAGNAANNADVRAFAAGTLQILRSEFEPVRVSELMAQQGTRFAQNAATEGRFSTDTIADLRRQAEGSDPVAKLRAVLALRDLGNLGGMTEDRVFNQAVVSTLRPGQNELNMQVLQALRVTDPNRDLRPEDRAAIVALLDQDTSRANAPVKLEILRRINEFAVTPDERSRAARFVEFMVDRGSTRLFAQDPELRAAAVRAIGTLNLQNDTAVNSVRSLLLLANEPDARVRLAAIQTLERLRVPNLPATCLEALRTETDPTVRAALADVRGQNARPIRNERYMEAIQAHQAALAESQRNNTFDAAAWLRNHPTYTLLNSDNYDNLRRERGETPPSTNWWQRNMPFPYLTASLTTAELEQRREGARVEVAQQRVAQFQALAREAGQRGEAGHNARMALLFIATGQNPPFRDTDVPVFREWAAQQIRHLCQTGAEVRGEFLKGIQQGLLNTELPASVREHLLEALVHFVDNTPPGPARALDSFFENPRTTTPEQVMDAYRQAGITAPATVRAALDAYQATPNATTRAGVLSAIEQNANTSSSLYRQIASLAVARALTEQFRSLPTETQPQYHQTLGLQRRMIDLLRQWNYHSVYPALEAARASHPYPAIREHATQALADMRDRIDPVWTRTAPDTDTLPPQRAQALERVLGSGNADDLVQALFTAARGRAIADQTDPRIVLYRRALRDGGTEPDRPRQEGDRWLIDGAEKVRLAAARVILERNERGEYVNSGFSDEDRRRAVETVARTAFEGSLPGYKQDALAMLQRELGTPPASPNPLMLVALRDMLLANPAYDRTVAIGSNNFTVRQLLENNFRGDSSGLAGGTGTHTRQTGRGTLEEEYRAGELIRTTETMSDGTVVTTRRLPGGRFVIEELKNGQIERTVPPTGRTYASVLIDDLTRGEGGTLDSRMAAATRLLTHPRVAPTDAERRSALSAIHTNAISGNESERLQWARYLATAPGIDNERDREWRDKGFIAVNELAAHARDENVRRQAQEMTAVFTPQQVHTAMSSMVAGLNADVTQARQQNDERRRLLSLTDMSARHSDQTRRYLESLRQAGINPTGPLPDITPNPARTTETLNQLSRLYEQNGRRAQDAPLLIEAYVAASSFMPAGSETMTRMRQQIEQAIGALSTQPLQPGDARIPALRRFIESTGDDGLRARSAEALITTPGLPDDANRRAAYAALAKLIASTDESARNRAIAAFERIPATDQDAVLRARQVLLESALNIGDNREARHRVWSHYQRFLERIGVDRNDQDYQFASNRAIEYAPAGGTGPGAGSDAVANAERLAAEAIGQNNHHRARQFFEQALAARQNRDGENNVDLARARLRFAEYLRSSAETRGRMPDTSEIIRQQELATQALRAQQPDSLETANALRDLAASYVRYNASDLTSVRDRTVEALNAAVSIFERNESTRNHGDHAAALSSLASLQMRTGRPEEAYRNFEKLIQLSAREGMPAAQKAEVLRYCFERARGFMGTPQGAAAVTAVQPLLARITGLDGLTRQQREPLADSIWWIGRNLAEANRASESYPYFDKALEQYELALGETDGNFTSLLSFYADVLQRNGQTERATQLQTRARTILERLRARP